MDLTSLVEDFLERYARALSSGDLDGVVACWEVPALVLSDEGAIAVGEGEEVRRFFASAVEWYRTEGLASTRPTAVEVTELSPRVAGVDVEWSALDADGVERLREGSHYLLRLDDSGRPRIRVTVAPGASRTGGNAGG